MKVNMGLVALALVVLVTVGLFLFGSPSVDFEGGVECDGLAPAPAVYDVRVFDKSELGEWAFKGSEPANESYHLKPVEYCTKYGLGALDGTNEVSVKVGNETHCWNSVISEVYCKSE